MRAALLIAVLTAACGGHDAGGIDDTIGAACTSDRQCADRCFLDNNDKFPGGFCSIACASDRDCPSDTLCMQAGGGSCLFVCPAFDCTRLGPGWHCSDKDRVGGGKDNVCIGD